MTAGDKVEFQRKQGGRWTLGTYLGEEGGIIKVTDGRVYNLTRKQIRPAKESHQSRD